jgi:hypothetical protein
VNEVDNVISKLRYFEGSQATRESGRRLADLLRAARYEANRFPTKLPLATVLSQQFAPGFENLTAHKYLDRCAVNIDKEIEFAGLWNKPVNELGFRAARCLDEIHNTAATKLGLEHRCVRP